MIMEKTSNAASEKTVDPTADASAVIILVMDTKRERNWPSEKAHGVERRRRLYYKADESLRK